MKKLTFATIEHIFDSNRKGAKYSVNGGKSYVNGGEFAEIALKAGLGLDASKDANTPFDEGSDIEELEMSVKSNKATLTSVKLGSDYNEVKENYFKRVHSTSWAWVVTYEDADSEAYIMNREEFEEFMDNWSGFDKSRQVVRFKATSGKMVKWLEERV